MQGGGWRRARRQACRGLARRTSGDGEPSAAADASSSSSAAGSNLLRRLLAIAAHLDISGGHLGSGGLKLGLGSIEESHAVSLVLLRRVEHTTGLAQALRV